MSDHLHKVFFYLRREYSLDSNDSGGFVQENWLVIHRNKIRKKGVSFWSLFDSKSTVRAEKSSLKVPQVFLLSPPRVFVQFISFQRFWTGKRLGYSSNQKPRSNLIFLVFIGYQNDGSRTFLITSFCRF